MANALDEAVRAAVVETPEEPKPAPEIPQEPKKEEEPEEEVDSRVAPALQLYESLRDPTTAAATIAALAAQAGINLGAPSAAREVKKDLLTRMREKVPEEQRFLVDSLAPAINELINEHMQEVVAPLAVQQEQLQIAEARNQYDSAFNKLEKKFEDARKFEKEMNELANKFPVSPNVNLEEYMEGLYKIASSDKQSEKAVNRVVNRVNKTSREVPIKNTNVDETSIKKGSKLPTLNEAVKAAMRGEKLI